MFGDDILISFFAVLGACFIVFMLVRSHRPEFHLPSPPSPPPLPAPVCGCGHHYAYHDLKTGKCNNIQAGITYKLTGGLVDCFCKQYTGPQPLPEYFAPELGGDS